MKRTMKKLLALMLALMLALSAFALAEEVASEPQAVEQPGEGEGTEAPEGQAPEDGQSMDDGAYVEEDAIVIEPVDALYEEQSADLVEEEPDLPSADEASELPVEDDVYSVDAAAAFVGFYVVFNDNIMEALHDTESRVFGSGKATLNGNTLTLNNCEGIESIKIDYSYGEGEEAQELPYEAMYDGTSEQDTTSFTIVLEGKNTIATGGMKWLSYYPLHLTIEGEGTLTIECTGSGISASGGVTVAGGTVEITSSGSSYVVDTGESKLCVTGGTLTLKATGTGETLLFKKDPDVDLSKIDVFYGADKDSAKKATSKEEWETAAKSKYARFEVKKEEKIEEKKADNPTTPAPDPAPAQPAAISAVKKNGRATLTAAPGTVYQLDLGGATGRKFKSSNGKVATVNGSGQVTMKKAGKTIISFKVGNKTRKLRLTFKDSTVPTRVTVASPVGNAVKKGDTVTLTPAIPEGTNSGFKWKSSNRKVATVKNGVVKFKKKGRVTITCTAKRGKKKAKVKFTVSQ